MSESIKKPGHIPESYQPKKPEIVNMMEQAQQQEKLIETFTVKKAVFEVFDRPDVLWVGTLAWADNNHDEPDIDALLKKFQAMCEIPKQHRINPDWSAGISINYCLDGKAPRGMLFAQETYSPEQDSRYDIFTQPAGLYLRVRMDKHAGKLIGKKNYGEVEMFGLLADVAVRHGYRKDYDNPIEIFYHDHEHGTGKYAYIAVEKAPELYQPSKPEIMHMAEQAQLQSRLASIEELQAYVASGGEPPRSNKIKKIRRLWHDLKCENFYLEGCFAAVMKAAGDAPKAIQEPPTEDTKSLPLAFEYTFMLTISGTLFTQTYPSLTSSAGMSSELGHQIMPRMFRQLSWSYYYIDRDMIASQPELVMATIKSSVKKGIPVMSCGIGNVQLKERYFGCMPEWCLIGGYDKDGGLLVNVYPEDAVTDKSGYITVKDGLAGSDGLYILGEKQHEINYAQLYKQALQTIPALITQPAYHGVSFGQQAYYDWADAMLDDANFADLPDDFYAGFLWKGYQAPWIAALTNECYIRRFFDQVIAECQLPEAVKVKEIYTKIHANLFKMQELHGGDFDPDREVISKPELREELAGILRHMGDLHNELLELFA